MPIFIFIAIGLIMAFYWEEVVSNVAIIGSISIALAFMATAWAAFEARSSAKAAMKAVSITADSLLETKKTSFKQWLALLLEQHDALHDEVRKELEADSILKTRMDMNIAKSYYYALTKKTTLIKYANLITSILTYIDHEFYLNGNNINERKQYVKQLNHRIDSNVKLAIAVLGLNIDNNKIYSQEKLYLLLTKYDFFEKDVFFDKIFEHINSLENYIMIMFNHEYVNTINYYVNLVIQNRKCGLSNPIKDNDFGRHERLNFTVFWAYKNICGDIIRKAFDNLPLVTRSTLIYNMENATQEINKIKNSVSGFIGGSLTTPTSKPLTLRNERHLVRLVNLYFNKKDKIDVRSVMISYSNSNVYLDQLVTKMEDYKLNLSFSELNVESDKDSTINGTLKIAEEIIEDYKSRLDEFLVKKPNKESPYQI